MKNWSKQDYKLTAGRVLGANQGIYNRAVDNLNRFSDYDTATKEKKAEECVEIFKEWHATNQASVSPVPTRIQQAMVDRMESQLLADTVAQQACVLQEGRWGEQMAYRNRTRQTIEIKKIGEMGGMPQVIQQGTDSITWLGEPTMYSTLEFAVPMFRREFPQKYLEEIEDISTWAAADLATKVDTDLWTLIDAQIDASWDTSLVFTYLDSRRQDVPTGNDLDLGGDTAATDKFTKKGMQDLYLHADRIDRAINTIWIPTLAQKDLWNWLEQTPSTNGYPGTISQELAAEIERTGASVISLWGKPPVRIQPVNILDGNASNTYGRMLMTPTKDRTAPQGVAWMYTYPMDVELTSPLVHMRRDVARGQIFDYFVMQYACLMTSVSYQKPNYARLKLITA